MMYLESSAQITFCYRRSTHVRINRPELKVNMLLFWNKSEIVAGAVIPNGLRQI